MNIVVFLQNAWSPFWAGKVWPRESWLRALEKSRSGQRLRVMIDDLEVCEETTPIVTLTSNGKPKPDFEHISEILIRREPKIIVACGKQAEIALLKYKPPRFLSVPHPAHRTLTNELYHQARVLLNEGFEGQLALRQLKGSIKLENFKAG